MAAEAGQPHIFKEGRKLNGEYCIIRGRSTSTGVLYSAYNPKTSQDCNVQLSTEELRAILGDEYENLYKSSSAVALHTKVVDSIGFEDRLLASEFSAPARSQLKSQYRAGKKIAGRFIICTGSVTASSALRIEGYDSSSSKRYPFILSTEDIMDIVRTMGHPPLRCPADLTLPGLQVSAEPSELKPFWNACLESVLPELTKCVQTGVPAASMVSADTSIAQGDGAFLRREWAEARSHYSRAVTAVPDSMAFRLKYAAAVAELGGTDEVLQECKRVIALARQCQQEARRARTAVAAALSREPAVVEAGGEDGEDGDGGKPGKGSNGAAQKHLQVVEERHSLLLGADSASGVISKAYTRMGTMYIRQGRNERALNVLTLALKSADNASARSKLEGLLNSLRSALAAEGSADASAVTDVEELLGRHEVIGYRDSLSFACTGCGECCRSADHIFLSPGDLWRMTRAPAMALQGAASTHQIREVFKHAFHFTVRDGVPIAQLRPAKTQDQQCAFAYPLYRWGGTEKLLSFEEVHSRKLADYVPVHPNEYNLTEEEEAEGDLTAEAAAAGSIGSDDRDGDSDDDDMDCLDEPRAAHPEAILNSFGKEALGCRFGRNNMPAMCSTYPMAREMTWADFWHEPAPAQSSVAPAAADDHFAGGDGDHTMSDQERVRRDEATILGQQQYVVVKTAECEGFFEDGDARTHAFQWDDHATTQELSEFIEANSFEEKWETSDWFKRLMGGVLRTGVVAASESLDVMVRQEFSQVLARIWYDFDRSSAAATRPFKTWRRAKRSIEALTETAVQQTKSFVAQAQRERASGGSPPVSGAALLGQYKECMRQAGL